MIQKLSTYQNKYAWDHLFPFAVYDLFFEKSETFITPHWHNGLEILCIYSDAIIYLNGTPFPIKKGDILFINPHVFHSALSETDGYAFAILFDFSLFTSTISDFLNINILSPLISEDVFILEHTKTTDPLYPALLQYLDSLVTLNRKKPLGFEIQVKSILYSVFYTLYQNNYINPIDNPSKKLASSVKYVQSAIEYMEIHYQKNISIDDLANHLNISKYHFIRIFKAITNTTPIDFLNNFRLEHAEKLLHTDITITIICYSTGFNSLSYFIRKFKMRYGLTPEHYRSNLYN
ncbi:MAG: AraC family transcriptional regulator [Lachnospiraceae bacterium]